MSKSGRGAEALLWAPAGRQQAQGGGRGADPPWGAPRRAPSGTFRTGWQVGAQGQPTSRLGPVTPRPAALVGGLSEGGWGQRGEGPAAAEHLGR